MIFLKSYSTYRYGFSSSHVEIWELDHKEGWAMKELMLSNCGAGEDSWEPLGQQGDPTTQFSRKSTLKTDAELEAPILWPPDVKSCLIGKDSYAGKDWGQKGKGVTEDEMVRWHHQLSRHEFEKTPGDSEGQGSLACCSPWGFKESDTTKQLNDKNVSIIP